ncbi:DUF3352 domain-containing protein [[Phormidium] sp. ETS-05]|uniref:DUF3352 domain-containing protein n=1 Tax=[Phormidium] sp. ETS-05 TaxID=222819 RepID=UPI0018EEFDA6|nr:DUF3352 domain-containing protein [[Phormidium] sp. ETS-05]
MTDKTRPFISIISASLLVTILFLAGGCGSKIHQLKSQVTAPESAIFIPKQSALMVSLLVNPEDLASFIRQSAAGSDPGKIGKELNQIKENLLANTDVKYEEDIQPWLGDEISLAVTDIDLDKNQANGLQPGYLLALATRDAAASSAFLERLWQNKPISGSGAELVLENYAGVKLIYTTTTPEAGNLSPLAGDWASAVVGSRFVLFANHPKVLREAINTVQAANLNLTSSEIYQQVSQNAPEGTGNNRIGMAFINPPQLAAWLNRTGLKTTGENDNLVAISLGLNPNGLVADTLWIKKPGGTETGFLKGDISHLDEASGEETRFLSAPVQALDWIPAAANLVAAGQDLQGLSGDSGLTSFFVNSINSLLTSNSLAAKGSVNLEEDIFSWVQDSYALGLLSYPGEDNLDWIFVAQRGEKTAAGISHLETLARERGINVGPVTFGNQEAIAWTKLTTGAVGKSGARKISAEVQAVRATVGEYEIFANRLAAIEQALKAPESGSFLASTKLAQAQAALPQQNSGYFYLDWVLNRPLLLRQFPFLKFIEIAGKAAFSHLESFTLTTADNSDGYNHASIFIRLRV